MTVVLADPALRFSLHAVDRYVDRVLQVGDRHQAEAHLTELALSGEITASPPHWFADRAKEETDRYLVIGDLVFPLVLEGCSRSWLAKTCIPRGCISDDVRGRRNIAKARGRRHRHSQAVGFALRTGQPC